MEPTVSPHFPTESIKACAESIGISGLGDDVSRELSDDITFKLKSLVQDALKLKHHSKRRKLTTGDFDCSLKGKGIEPLYGSYAKEHLPFRFASGGGRELHFLDDKEIDLKSFAANHVQRFPLQPTVKAHWLAIEGVQPTVPENPPPIQKDLQKKESVDPAAVLATQTDARDKKHIHGRGMKSIETVRVKQLATHELSAEQQLYYKEITEACVSSDESKRAEALHSLTYDPGLFLMVPRLCTFIAEGVRINVVQKKLALLIYLMRMAKALVDNQSLCLEKYLHEIVPSVMSCIVSKHLCMNPDADNHWALRDFSARLICQLCKNYHTVTNSLQTRITRIFANCLESDKTPLASVYGSIAGLSELGPEVVKSFILPSLAAVGARIEKHLDDANTTNKLAANSIRNLILKTVTPALKSLKTPETVPDYKKEYGFLGPSLLAAVAKSRQIPATQHAASSQIKAIPATRIVQHSPGVSVAGVGARTVVVNKQGPSVIPTQANQKVIIMNRPMPQHGTPVATDANLAVTQTIQSGGQKYVVVSTPNTIPIKTEIKEEPMDIMSPPHISEIL